MKEVKKTVENKRGKQETVIHQDRAEAITDSITGLATSFVGCCFIYVLYERFVDCLKEIAG